eukprot:RCo044169
MWTPVSRPPPQRPMSTCPVCQMVVPLDTIQAHTEQCLAAAEVPKAGQCPVCQKVFPGAQLTAHVNACLESSGSPGTSAPRHALPANAQYPGNAFQAAVHPAQPLQMAAMSVGVPLQSQPPAMGQAQVAVVVGIPVGPSVYQQMEYILGRRAVCGFIIESLMLVFHVIILRVALNWSPLLSAAALAMASSAL